ncbi:MAG TPA: hypothetical protein PLP05_11550 [Sedimentisphaerales bacterium]|nr:hypothetical protein [Sedimentisphaerales bacterium]
MFSGHWFWFGLTSACIIWYSTITVYVAFKGSLDIKRMLEKLSDGNIKSDVEKS